MKQLQIQLLLSKGSKEFIAAGQSTKQNNHMDCYEHKQSHGPAWERAEDLDSSAKLHERPTYGFYD